MKLNPVIKKLAWLLKGLLLLKIKQILTTCTFSLSKVLFKQFSARWCNFHPFRLCWMCMHFIFFSNLTLDLVLTATSRSAILYIDFLDCDLEFATAKVPYCQLDQITVHDGQFSTLSVPIYLIYRYLSLKKGKYLWRNLKVYFFFNFEIMRIIFLNRSKQGPFQTVLFYTKDAV